MEIGLTDPPDVYSRPLLRSPLVRDWYQRARFDLRKARREREIVHTLTKAIAAGQAVGLSAGELAELETGRIAARERFEGRMVDFAEARERARRLRRPPVQPPRLHLVPPPVQQENASEVHDRASAVVRILERCAEELARLELVPTGDLRDLDALSMAKGFTERAHGALARRFA